jgi:5'-deoxynucleotidase YfbR-like HD superfamily hydrolase
MPSSQQSNRGDWMQTYSGLTFFPLDPQPEDISIKDIAHSLSMQCRFAGHLKKFYSVAEHCVRVSYICPPELALWGLLHDASEAFLIDLPRPVKYLKDLAGYKRVEKKVMKVIAQKFGLSMPEPPEIKAADVRLLITEQRDLLGRQTKPWRDMAEPLPGTIHPWSHKKAEARFNERFKELYANSN